MKTRNEVEGVLEVLLTVARLDLGDGVVFAADGMTAKTIAEETKVPGVRLRVPAGIGQVQLILTLEVGSGDAITPAPVLQRDPTLLGPENGAFEVYTVTLDSDLAV